MRTRRGPLSRSFTMFAAMSVLWFAHLCALSGESLAVPADVSARSASLVHTSDVPVAGRNADGDCDDCEGHDRKGCPGSNVCCSTWVIASRLSLLGPVPQNGPSQLAQLFLSPRGFEPIQLEGSPRLIVDSESPPASPAVLGPVQGRAPPTL